MWLALSVFAAAVLAAHLTIESDYDARCDRTRCAWWEFDGQDVDECDNQPIRSLRAELAFPLPLNFSWPNFKINGGRS